MQENSNGGGQPCRIFHVDYGNMENVSSEELRKLKKEFYDVPAQAILCKIDGIKPIEVSQPTTGRICNWETDQ